MKFLFDLPNEQLLPATCDLADAVEQLVKASGIMEFRKEPEDGESNEAAAKRNAKKMIVKLCKEYPKETGAVLDRLWVLEKDDEKAPNALVTAGILLVRKDVLTFFTSLVRLAE